MLDRLRTFMPLIMLLLAIVVHPRPHAMARDRDDADRECFMFARLDGADPSVANDRECDWATAPASTFKIPHALIALQTGVVDERTIVPWDGTAYDFESWRHDHTLESAIRLSVYPFFRRTAALIGAERMRRMLGELRYAADTFDGDVREFWINGDLVVSPREQLVFLRRLFGGDLPITPRHVETVVRALVMPPGRISNASGVHDFPLRWPADTVVRAKTGNTTVGGERVSWLIGALESRKATYVFVSRVRGQTELSGTAGSDLALRELNGRAERLQ